MTRHLKRLSLAVWALMATVCAGAQLRVCSPDGRLTLDVADSTFTLLCGGRPAARFVSQPSGQLRFVRHLREDYTMTAGKRRHCINEANEYEVTAAGDGQQRLVVRLYNDGLAFRHEGGAGMADTYIIADGTRRWPLKWSDSYEGFFPLAAKAEDGRWAYPLLTEPADGLFALITEADISRGQSASSLVSQGQRYRVTADRTDPESPCQAPGHTPWRVIIAGTLADVVESTLVTDVSQPSRIADTSWIMPGTASWVYWANNHGSNDYDIICRYTDLASRLQLPYVLIDAEWDEMKDGKTIEQAVDYAKSQGVRPMIWYNSTTGWIEGAPTPKYRLNKADDREREFDWCERIGVAGVKVDFFSGDDQRSMDYCIDLMESAARHHLLINFHGATVPRGWQRTWPNLLTTEAVYGAEWYNNAPTLTQRAASHNATLPFTRNVVGPMDYTPCTFSDSQHPHITTNAHELALTVLFESGLQHLADRPESYLAQPTEVQRFLSTLPAAWLDTRLVGGYPGRYAVMARQSDAHTWYVAGINGTDQPLDIDLPQDRLPEGVTSVEMLLDAPAGTPDRWLFRTRATLPAKVSCLPRGGFVMVVKTAHRLAHDVSIEFLSPGIVHVVKGQPTHSLVVTAKPQQTDVVRRGNELRSAQLCVRQDTKTGSLTFLTHAGKVLLREKSCDVSAIRQTFTLDCDEAIYGLGTLQDGKMNRRGTHKLMEQSNLEDFQNVVQSIKGWGIYWENYSPTQFDDDDSGMTFDATAGEGIDYYFMYAGNADGVIAQMRQLTGDVPMFPLWTYGFWQSKERYKTAAETEAVVDRYRELQVPLDGIIQDWQYWGSNYLWNAMDFLAEDFAKGRQMIDNVHRKNAHFMISIWASFGPHTKAFRQLDEQGLLMPFETWPQSGISHVWPPRMDYPSGVRVYDAFSPQARAIYWNNLKTLYDYGADAWWMDSTDPDFFNPRESDYAHHVYGGTWRSQRNAFPLETVRGVYQAQRRESDRKRVFIMTRSSFAGQQHYGSNMWSGDVTSSWEMLRKQVPAGLNFTLTGNPNFNTDIGGFFCGGYNSQGAGSAPRNPSFQELYVRWMQYALFCPVFRSHGADAPREIWHFGKKGEPVYDAIEKTIRLRYRLIPYLYSTAWQVTSANGSYMRPLFCDFAADRRTWDLANEFMFGSSILAAPVLEQQYDDTGDWTQAKTVRKYLPKGTAWYDFWSNRLVQGGQTLTVETSLDRVPMFVRAGTILPLGPEMQYVGEQPWDNLEIRVYPGADAHFTLYEDEGDSYNYERGLCSTIDFEWDERRRTLTIAQRKGSYPGMLGRRQFTIVMPDGKKQVADYSGEALTIEF